LRSGAISNMIKRTTHLWGRIRFDGGCHGQEQRVERPQLVNPRNKITANNTEYALAA